MIIFALCFGRSVTDSMICSTYRFLLPESYLKLLENSKPRPKNLKAVYRLLDELPDDLAKVYERFLGSIEKEEREQVSHALKFLTCAKRPMKLSELQEVFEPDSEDFHRSDGILRALSGLVERSGPRPETLYSKTLSRLAANFDPRSDLSDDNATQEEVIQFNHPTVAEFLAKREESDEFFIRQPDVDLFAAEYCLNYLGRFDWNALEQERKTSAHQHDAIRHPFLIYAANYWYVHAASLSGSPSKKELRHRECSVDIPGLEGGILQRLRSLTNRVDVPRDSSCLSPNSVHWWAIETRTMVQSDCNLPNVKAAALRGYAAIVENLLAYGAIKETADESLLPRALAASISKSYEEMVLLLLGDTKSASLFQPWTHWTEAGCTNGHGKSSTSFDDVVLRLIGKMRRSDFEIQDGTGRTPLHVAADYGSRRIVQELIDKGANIEAKDNASRTPLLRAVKAGHTDLVLILLERGAEMEVTCSLRPNELHDLARGLDTAWEALGIRGQLSEMMEQTSLLTSAANETASWRALHIAAYYGSVEIAQLLLWRGEEVDIRDAQGRAPLHMATEQGHRRMAEILLENDANVDAKDYSGLTPLALAARKGQREMVSFLMDVYRYSHPDQRDDTGQTPLHQAAAHGAESDLIELLLRVDDISARDRHGCTALHLAAQFGHRSAVNCLVKHARGILTSNWVEFVGSKTNAGWTAIAMAAFNSHDRVVKQLIAECASIDAGNWGQQSLLTTLVQMGNHELAQFLIEQTQLQGTLNLPGRDGFTPIQHAVANRQFKCLKVLIKSGVAVDTNGEFGMTSLHLAAMLGMTGMVDALITRGADISAADSSGFTALHQAAYRGHRSVIKCLLSRANKKGILKKCIEQKPQMDTTALHVAAIRGYPEVVKCCLRWAMQEEGLENYVNEQDSQGCTALHLAIPQKNPRLNIMLACAAGMALNTADNHGDTVLHLAAGQGDRRLVTLLLSKGAGSETRNHLGKTPLIVAASYGDIETVEVLLKRGAQLASTDHHGWAAAHYAAFHGHDAVLRLLTKQKNFNVHATTFHGWTVRLLVFFTLGRLRRPISPLYDELQEMERVSSSGREPSFWGHVGWDEFYSAAALQEVDLLKNVVLKHDFKTGVRDKRGCTALTMPVMINFLSGVKFLINQDKAMINEETKFGYTSVHCATIFGCKAVLKVLLHNGANTEARDRNGMTPLHFAVMLGHTSIIQVLWGHMRNVDPPDYRGNTPLHEAASLGKEDVGWILLAMGADANAKNIMGETPLHLAASGGFEGMVLQLLSKGAKINTETVDGITPLQSAVLMNRDKIVKILLENKACLDSCIINLDKHTPLHTAAFKGHEKVVQLLLEAQVNVNARSLEAHTPLHMAADAGHENVAKTLVEHEADVELFNDAGQTALHMAAMKGYVGIAEALINRECPLDDRDSNGHTPLHLAAQEGHHQIVSMLIDRGCEISVRDCDNQTPQRLAAQKGHKQVEELLENRI